MSAVLSVFVGVIMFSVLSVFLRCDNVRGIISVLGVIMSSVLSVFLRCDNVHGIISVFRSDNVLVINVFGSDMST